MKFAHRVPPEGVKFENMNIGHATACINAASKETEQVPALVLLHSAWMSLKDAHEDNPRDATQHCIEACWGLFNNPSIERAEYLHRLLAELLDEVTAVKH